MRIFDLIQPVIWLQVRPQLNYSNLFSSLGQVINNDWLLFFHPLDFFSPSQFHLFRNNAYIALRPFFAIMPTLHYALFMNHAYYTQFLYPALTLFALL